MSKDNTDLSGLIESYLRDLFDNRNVSIENRKKLWKYYYNTLSKGVELGYNPKPEMYDPKLAHSLKYDVAKFSAFKETSFKNQLETLLTKDGKVTPWSDFKKAANELHIDYNQRWLKTEYDHTVASANMAEKWKDFEADSDLYPNLKIVTAGDARVRDSHKILDGLTLPITHEFWKSHTTPFDWGCRCDIIQTDEQAHDKVPNYNFKPAFENNPALSGKIFGQIPYADGMTNPEFKASEIMTKEEMNSLRKEKDKELLKWAGTKIKRGSFESYEGKQFKNEVRLSKSNIENILNHISIIENKDAIKDIDTILENAEFLEFKELDKTKDSKNYGKKVGRGVVGYNYYKSVWNGLPVQIDMEVMSNGYEQPYAILIDKK